MSRSLAHCVSLVKLEEPNWTAGEGPLLSVELFGLAFYVNSEVLEGVRRRLVAIWQVLQARALMLSLIVDVAASLKKSTGRKLSIARN